MKKITEHQIQSAFFEYVRLMERSDSRYLAIHATPNQGIKGGGFWGQKRKAEGLRKGFPDIAVLLPRGGYHGLFIELKVPPNKTSTEQQQCLQVLKNNGYLAVVITTKNVDDLISYVQDYLNLESF